MDKNQALQNLLNGSASEDDIELLKRLLASGEISIGGNVNQSVIIIGSGNTVELPPAALDRLNARPMLGNLDRDLTGEEIASGLRRLDKLLPNRAPVLLPHYKEQVGRLRPTLKTEIKALSETLRRERLEALAAINSICVEAVDISFNGLALGEVAPDYDARSPFRGLESFRPEDSEFFFGREALTEKLLGKIKAHSFLAVLGTSGSGKSSLMMAGVIPALDLDYCIFRPGTNPLDKLESARGKALIVVDQFEELFTLTRDESTREDFIAHLLDESTRVRIILTLRSDFLGEVGAYRTLSAEIQSHLEIIPPMDMDELRRAMEGQAGVVGLRFEADLSQQILDDVAGEPGAMPLLQHALWELWNRRHGRNLRASEYRAFGGVKQAITSTAEKVYADCSKPEQDQVRDIFLRLTRLDEGDEGRDTRRRVPLGDFADAASITLLLDKLANARLIVKTVNADKTEVEVAHEALIRHWERLRLWLNEDRDNLRLHESVSESSKEWERSGKHESLLNSRWVKLDEALLLAQNSRYRLNEIEHAYLNGCVALRNREQRERERRLRYTVFASIAAAMIFLVLGSFGLIKSNEATRQAETAQANANAAATAQVNAEEQKQIALARQIAAQAQSVFTSGNLKIETSVLLAIQSMTMFPNIEAEKVIQNSLLSYPITQMKQDTSVEALAFSPDGKYIASGEAYGLLHIWDAMTGNLVITLPQNDIESVVFSSDGKYLVSGGCDEDDLIYYTTHVLGRCLIGSARVWEIPSGREISRITYNGIVSAVDINPNGEIAVSGGCDQLDENYQCSKGSVRILNIETGKELVRMIHDGWVLSVKFSPDGRYVVSGSSDMTSRVWDVIAGKEVARMYHSSRVNTVAFSPDGMYVLSGGDNTAKFWEALTGKEVSHSTHDGTVKAVALSPDGKLVVSASDDETVRVWDGFSGKTVFLMYNDSSINQVPVSFSPDGRYIVSESARVWSALTGEEIAHGNGFEFESVVFSSDSKYIASGDSFGNIQVWKIGSGKEIARIFHEDEVNFATFTPDGRYIVSMEPYSKSYNNINVWDMVSEKEVFRKSLDGPDTLDISPDGRFIVSAEGYYDALIYYVTIWNTANGKEGFRVNLTDTGQIASCKFSPDGKYIALGSYDGVVLVLDATTGSEVFREFHDGADYNNVYSLDFSPDGKYIVSGSRDGTIRVWDFLLKKNITTLNLGVSIKHITFSPNGKYIVSGSPDGTVLVWNFLAGKEATRVVHNDSISTIDISPDSKYVLSGGDNTARVWDIETGSELSRMTHDGPVSSAQFSPDGEYVVSGGDKTARVWLTNSGVEVARITHNSWVVSVAMSSDGRHVVSADQFGSTVRVWFFLPEDIIDDACSRVTRNLTRTEWQQYIGDALPYQAVCPNLPIEPKATPSP